MHNAISRVPEPKNEPVFAYRSEDKETKSLKSEISRLRDTAIDIPLVIDGQEVRTGKTEPITSPHDHKKVLGHYHVPGPNEISAAIQSSLKAQVEWSRMPGEERAAVFLKAAELLATKYRNTMNASTMLGQSKTCHQAEIDAACELIDFFRFNVSFQSQLYAMQPQSAPGQWNRMSYRPLEGFTFAVAPFNFTSISVNLAAAPALMGNVVVWKPSSTSIYSSYIGLQLLQEAGLPGGVIQFLPGRGSAIGEVVMKDTSLAGVHFTGSTATFQHLWSQVGSHISNYRTYPRVVGETGGKDFIFAHPSANKKALVAQIVRGAFEYQGQKCSAASRAYIPRSLWNEVKENLIEEIKTIKMGDVSDFSNFMGAVIDRRAFDKIKGYIEHAKQSNDAEILVGGGCDDSVGYFIEPTVVEAKTPNYKSMVEEIFGPVITLFVYEDSEFEETLKICDETAAYALTGAIFAEDRSAVLKATAALSHTAGNYYINVKPTGAVVGQQPFGGSRASGTNDKAGSLFNLLRWVSVRTISETFVPPENYRYPYMTE